MYATKMKTEPAKMLKNLWGDRFYFAKEKKWKGEKGPGGKVMLSNLVGLTYCPKSIGICTAC